MKYNRLFLYSALVLICISFGLDLVAQATTDTITDANGTSSYKEVAYAIPFIILLGVIYIMKNTRRKMITFGGGQMPLMTSIYLLTGSAKDSGENLKKYKAKQKAKTISGTF